MHALEKDVYFPVQRGKPFHPSQLPHDVTDSGIDFHQRNSIFGYISQPLLNDLAFLFKGKNVLEVYAGRGHLSAALQYKGVSVKPTSLQSGHDGSYELAHVTPVEHLDAATAVSKYADWLDYLLVCWPTTDTGMEKCLEYLPHDKKIIFIGEVTDYTRKPAFLGGCATDAFFDKVIEVKNMSEAIRYPSPRQDQLKVFRKR